jgi:glycerol-3-phosphate cytidylyltransferase
VDPSVERAEKNTPIETVEERRERLDSCRWVDEVHVYRTEADLVKMLELVKPDVRFLGTDYAKRKYTGQELNIPIYWHERNHSYSSSSLRRRIVEADG